MSVPAEHHRLALSLPSLSASIRHALPALLEGVVGPLAIFYVTLVTAGYDGAVTAALAWSVAVVVRRWVRRERVPATVLLGTVLVALRSVIAYVTGSAFLYFLQPTAATVLVGLAFLASAVVKRPLTERLARDFCPLDPALVARPFVRRFFVHIAFLWALVLLSNAGIVLFFLVTSSLRAFVLERTVTSWGLYAFGISVSTYWFMRLLRRHGIAVSLRLR